MISLSLEFRVNILTPHTQSVCQDEVCAGVLFSSDYASLLYSRSKIIVIITESF